MRQKMLTEEELEKCENPYEEIEKMAKGLVEELKEKEYDRGYEKGMEDAWETIKKTFLPQYEGGLSIDELVDVFGTFAYKEAKEKIDNYIKNKNAEFHVGDEVTIETRSSRKGVVILSEKSTINVIDYKGLVYIYPIDLVEDNLTKTGRHFDEVEKLLKMLKED